MQPDYLTFREAAELLRIADQTLRNKCSRGVFKRGVHWFKREGELGVRFKRAALVAWLEGQEQPVAAGNIPMANGYTLRVEQQ